MKFVDRKRELDGLDRFVRQPEAGLFILYGRRRVGKTRLLSHFLETRELPNSFYWTATTHNAPYQLRDFSQALLEFDPRFTQTIAPDFSFTNWEKALLHLADIVRQSKEINLIILDEFTYILRNDPAISSIFQKIWDHHLAKVPNLKLILTGSLLGMIAREIFSYQAPLYGRATAQLRLRPLPYAALKELFPKRDATERVAIYATTGGVPAYLDLFTQTDRFVTALKEDCLGSGSIMLSDPAVILHEQLQEPQTYESILSAIAIGYHTWKDIARMAAVQESSLGHYLKLLQELELIERRDPILSRPGGRRGRYHLKDHFFQFYYRFLVPQLTAIERGYTDPVVDKIYKQLRAFIGSYTFEELAREWVIAAAISDKLPWQPEKVGSYWRKYRGEGVQLDVVAANSHEKRLLIGECKWGKGLVRRRILTDLINRSQRMPQVAEGWTTEYALFAREGFTPALHELAKEKGVYLVSLPQLEQQLLEAML